MMATPKLMRHPLGFLTIAEKPSLEDLRKYYTAKYYQEAQGAYSLRYTEEEKNWISAKLEQRHAVLRKICPEARTMLDVGCGEGFALSFFRRSGWQVKGFDFSSAGLKAQNPSCLDALVTGDVFDLLDSEVESSRKYDVVWLQNVLEHVLEPVDLLASLNCLVADGGVAVITVPNDFSTIQKEALKAGHIEREFWVIAPDHISYFDHVSLRQICEATGWKCLEMLGDFPIDWFLFNRASNYIKDRSLGKEAHMARVQLENLLHGMLMEDVLAFWSAAGKTGIGRNITAFMKKE
jgi:2-polyprenyl-3-methyl-5-hydroxy-6-metoxy-1,4-benzoquinol methylase